MTSKVRTQQLPLDVLEQWHSIAHHATPDQIAIAFRGRRNVKQRHLLRHNYRVNLTSLEGPSSATMRAGVQAARLPLSEEVSAKILALTKTRAGLRTIGAITIAMDVLFRILEETTDVLPSEMTWERVGPQLMAALMEVCGTKIAEIDRDHESRDGLRTMMRLALVEARRFVQVHDCNRVLHVALFRAMLRPAGMFVEMENASRSGIQLFASAGSPPADEGPFGSDELYPRVPIAQADDVDADAKTRPMGYPALEEPPQELFTLVEDD